MLVHGGSLNQLYEYALLQTYATTIPSIRMTGHIHPKVVACSVGTSEIQIDFQELTFRILKTSSGKNAIVVDSPLRRKALDPSPKALRDILKKG